METNDDHPGFNESRMNWTVGNAGDMQHHMMTPEPGVMELQQIVRQLHMYYLPCIYSVGLLGNLASVVVLSDPICRGLAGSHYLTGILVVELVQILTLFHTWIEDMGVNLSMFHIGGWCQFSTFLSCISKFLGVWYTVFLSVECMTPGSFRRKFCHCWGPRVLMITATIIAVVVYMNISILYAAIAIGPRLVCMELYDYKSIHDKLAEGDAFVNAFIPNIIILVAVACCSRSLLFNCRCSRRREGLLDVDTSVEINLNAQHQTQQVSPDVNSSRRQAESFFYFLLFHAVCCLPLDGYRFVKIVGNIAKQQPPPPSLHGFLIDTILQYVKSSKFAGNIMVLFLAFPLYRGAMSRVLPRFTSLFGQLRSRRHSVTSALSAEETPCQCENV